VRAALEMAHPSESVHGVDPLRESQGSSKWIIIFFLVRSCPRHLLHTRSNPPPGQCAALTVIHPAVAQGDTAILLHCRWLSVTAIA
jgi:hypothetical protein